jgi:dCTP deaminase
MTTPRDSLDDGQELDTQLELARESLRTAIEDRVESSPLGSLALIRRMLLANDDPHRLVINPIVSPRQIGTTTIDLRLGTEWEATRSYRFGSLDPGEDPVSAAELLRNGVEEFRLTAGQRHGIVVHPGELLLALTLEYLKLPYDLWGQLEGRSTWARQGLQVHATAGMVDAGFAGYLTLELQNTGRIPLVLYPGLRVAQMAFHPVTMTAYSYQAKPDAAYSGQVRARSRFIHEPEHRYRYAYVESQFSAERERRRKAEELIAPAMDDERGVAASSPPPAGDGEVGGEQE